MKTQIVITNGNPCVYLTPENEFEKTMIENMHDESKEKTLETRASYNRPYGNNKDHCISIEFVDREEIKSK